MATHIEVAKHRLFDEEGLHVANVKLFPGSNRDATSDQMAEQISRAIAQIESGEADEVCIDDED